MKLYKIGNYFFRHSIPLLPKLFDLTVRLVHNSAVYSSTEIGQGTIFAYGGIGVIIHKRAIIGTNCVIGSNVTIGGKSGSELVPVIGDNVYISTGAKVLGAITIGDNCVIGANAVVVKSVPDNCLVAGVPAKIMKTDIDPGSYR